VFNKNALMIEQLNERENFLRLRQSINRKSWTFVVPTDVNDYY
jgi:hypothetical protein